MHKGSNVMIDHFAAFSAATALAGRGVPLPARDRPAALVRDGGSHHHDGNGHHNRNIISVHSPTHNRGYQHTSNGNAGGANPVQNALCRNVTSCVVSQKVNIVTPERPAPTVVPIEAIPEPQRALRPPDRPPAVRPATLPATLQAARPTRGPFMYLGPEGFMMMAADSSAPTGFGSALPFGFFG
jgi:hypothetical protein